MKFKLVEKLNFIDYSRKLTEALDTSMLSDEDFEVIEKDGMIYWLRERN